MLKLFLLVCFSVNVLVDSLSLGKPLMEGYIVGGKETDISKIPYQIAMYKRRGMVCGGFIVSPTHIVTAGRCVYDQRVSDISIRAGSTSNTEGGVVVKAKKLYPNPKFIGVSNDYDVGIIELETPFEFNNKTIKPIKLATKEPTAGTTVLVSGWGAINIFNQMPEKLQSVTFPVYDRTKCETAYKSYNLTITPRMICAGAEGKTAYYKDDGGPVVYNDEVVGIVSFGNGCGTKDLPWVYTNIANPEINKFIKDIAKL